METSEVRKVGFIVALVVSLIVIVIETGIQITSLVRGCPSPQRLEKILDIINGSLSRTNM